MFSFSLFPLTGMFENAIPSSSDHRYNSLRLQSENMPKSLTIKVLSSQSKVSVIVDGTTVS